MKAKAALCVLFVVAACGGETELPANQQVPVPETAADDSLIECAPAGAARFERNCSVEEVIDEDGKLLVLRVPDGGFRRLRVTDDGRGVIAADGSEPASVTPIGKDRAEVVIGNDRFRLPAKVKVPG